MAHFFINAHGFVREGATFGLIATTQLPRVILVKRASGTAGAKCVDLQGSKATSMAW